MTIGVTGHRFLAEPDRLDAALTHAVERLAHERPEPWTVVSALAEGADRLVARHLLDRVPRPALIRSRGGHDAAPA